MHPLYDRRVLRGLLGLVVGFGGAFVTVTAVERLAGRGGGGGPVELGQLDIEGYCAREEGMQALALALDALGWRCVGGPHGRWEVRDVDTYDVCRWQYDEAAYAILVDETDLDGWRCVRDP